MKKFIKLLVTLCVSFFLLSCNLPTATPPPLGPVVCGPDDLAAPALGSPAPWVIVDTLTPTLTWSANDPSEAYPYGLCSPITYKVRYSKGPTFSTTTEVYAEGAAPEFRNITLSALEPGQMYEWSVAPWIGTGSEPFAPSRYFFTGPMCDTDALRDPRLLEPLGGSVVDTLSPTLVWEYRDPCIPEGYRIDLSTDPSFADTSLSGGTGNPSTRWAPGSDLADCTWYYWRVSPINNTTLGPFSNIRSFMTNASGSCVYPAPGLVTVIPILTLVVPFPVIPIFILDKNANCRVGPDVAFEARRSYLQGQSLEVEGINDLRTWVYVRMPNEGENFCWVSLNTGNLDTDTGQIPVRESPPTPTPTAVPATRVPKSTQPPTAVNCQSLTTYDACKAQFNYCEWKTNVTNNSGSCQPKQP